MFNAIFELGTKFSWPDERIRMYIPIFIQFIKENDPATLRGAVTIIIYLASQSTGVICSKTITMLAVQFKAGPRLTENCYVPVRKYFNENYSNDRKLQPPNVAFSIECSAILSNVDNDRASSSFGATTQG